MLHIEGVKPRIHGVFAQGLLNAKKLVVFRDALAAAGRASLDLIAVQRNGEVGARKLVNVGEKVRLEDDLFRGSEGIVTKVDYRKERARVDFKFEGNACHTWVAVDVVRPLPPSKEGT